MKCEFYLVTANVSFVFSNVQLELGSVATAYEPYNPNNQFSNYTLPQTLYSLPNGVCDTFDEATGTGVQNIGKIVQDGRGVWAFSYKGSPNKTASFYVTNISNRLASPLNFTFDRFQYVTNDVAQSVNTDYECASMNGTQQYSMYMYLRINKSRLTGWSDGSKNLLDKTNNTLNELYIDGVTSTIKSGTGLKSVYAPITEGQTYTVSKSQATARFWTGFTSVTPANGVAVTNIMSGNSLLSLTSTAPTGSKYIVIYYWYSTDTGTEPNIQLELGSTATAYVPYVAPWTDTQKISALKSWLSANPVTVLYQLVTPIKFTGTQQTVTLCKNNIITTDSSGTIQTNYVKFKNRLGKF